MKCVTRKPAPPLDALVDSLWSLTDAPAHARERIVPGGTFELVFNLEQDEIRIYRDDGSVNRYRGAVVSGAFTRSFVVDTREHASMLGVHFKPGAARALTGTRADELMDAHVELGALWSPAAVDSLRDALCSAAGTAQRFAILERALRERLIRPSAPELLVQAVLSQPHLPLADVAAQFGRSHRSFIRAFAEHVGLTPKRFRRIRRFQGAFALATAGGQVRWPEAAIACGYCDQSHLIRDFVEFAGMAPAACARLARVPVKADHIALG